LEASPKELLWNRFDKSSQLFGSGDEKLGIVDFILRTVAHMQ